MTLEEALCIVVLVWAVLRAGYMRPCSPLLDKIAISVLGGSAAAYFVELHAYGSPDIAPKLFLAGVVLWVLPPTLRHWLRDSRVLRVVRFVIGQK
jgi:hypothetical protein